MSEIAEVLTTFKDSIVAKVDQAKPHVKRVFLSPSEVRVLVLEAYVETAFRLLDAQQNQGGKKNGRSK